VGPGTLVPLIAGGDVTEAGGRVGAGMFVPPTTGVVGKLDVGIIVCKPVFGVGVVGINVTFPKFGGGVVGINVGLSKFGGGVDGITVCMALGCGDDGVLAEGVSVLPNVGSIVVGMTLAVAMVGARELTCGGLVKVGNKVDK